MDTISDLLRQPIAEEYMQAIFTAESQIKEESVFMQVCSM